MGYTNPPEDRYHGRKQTVTKHEIYRTLRSQAVGKRYSVFLRDKIFEATPLSKFLWRHSQRSHVAPYFFTFLAFYYLGSLGHYYNYKANVVEDKWVEDYGQDVPHFRKMWFSTYV